jgi:hypothetical protein
LTAKPQWKNANLQRSEVVTCSHGCMCMFAICFSNFVPFFLPKIISFCFEACVSTPFAGLIGTQSLFFNNQPKLGISHNLIPFHPKQETPKDSGNPRKPVTHCGWFGLLGSHGGGLMVYMIYMVQQIKPMEPQIWTPS